MRTQERKGRQRIVISAVKEHNHGDGRAEPVLRPNGTLLFLEHVRSDDRRAARLQDLLTPAWRRLAGDCRLNRPTLERIRVAGLTIDEGQLHFFRNVLFPMVVGSARPRASDAGVWSPGEATTEKAMAPTVLTGSRASLGV